LDVLGVGATGVHFDQKAGGSVELTSNIRLERFPNTLNLK